MSDKHTPITLIRSTLFRALFLLLFAAAWTTGCKKDFDFSKAKSVEWKPDLALQLVHDSITLRRILTQGNAGDRLVIDENGDISILYYYNDSAFTIRPADLVKLSKTGFVGKHVITPAEEAIASAGDLVIPPVTFSMTLPAAAPGTRIDKVTVAKGTVRIWSSCPFNNAGYRKITFPEATLNGQVFSVTLSPVHAGTSLTEVSLDKVSFNLSASPGTIHATVEALLHQSAYVKAGDVMEDSVVVSIDSIHWFEGYVGQQTFDNLEDTVKVNVFNNAYTLGDLYFMDPQDSITIINSVGVPSRITIRKLVAINSVTGTNLDITGQLGSGAILDVPSPVMPLMKPVITARNYSNANTGGAMTGFFNVKPDRVAFKVTVEINPGGQANNFFADTSVFHADLRVKLPLWGHVDNLTYMDTFDLVIDKPEELDYIQFKTHIKNGLPLYGLMQVYFTDEHYVIKDSLAGSDRIFIEEAPVDPTTYLPYPGMFGIRDTTYTLDTQRLLNLENVKKMLVKALLFTPEEGTTNVKLRADQSVCVDFAVRARLHKEVHPWRDEQ